MRCASVAAGVVVALVCGCTRSPTHVSREASAHAVNSPADVTLVDAASRVDVLSLADSPTLDARTDAPAEVSARGPSPLTRVPNVFEAGAQRPMIDRPVAPTLTAATPIEIRFDVENGSYRTRTAAYRTLTGILRSPQLGLERRMGGSAAPTSCESNVQDDGRAMFFRCAGDVEDAHGRVWLDGDHVLLVMATSREDARPSSAPPSGTIERFTIPPGATVRFHAGHAALGM